MTITPAPPAKEDPMTAGTPDTQGTENAHASTATLAPPSPPDERPPTGLSTADTPAPKRRWVAWTVGILSAVIVVGSLVGVVVWALNRGSGGVDFSSYQGAYASAMKKAGVTAAFPTAPVDITTVKSAGEHPFEASFTAQEITALVNALTFSANIQGTDIAVSDPLIELAGTNAARLSGSITLNGSSYSAAVEGPVGFSAGQITSSGATKATAEGFSVGADRAKQATTGLLEYLNLYLGAAPGLTVTTAEVTPEGFKVRGTAPDTLSLP